MKIGDLHNWVIYASFAISEWIKSKKNVKLQSYLFTAYSYKYTDQRSGSQTQRTSQECR